MRAQGAMGSYFRTLYGDLFLKAWPAWFAGFGVGVINTLMFIYARPWTVDAGVRLWGSWLVTAVGVRLPLQLASPLFDSTSVLNIGLLAGAFVGALFSKEFALRIPRREGAVRGFGGGLMMGVGAAMTPGCNIGGFYTPLIAMSASGFAMMLGLILGALAGAKILLWEVKRMRADGGSREVRVGSSAKIREIQPALALVAGLIMILSAFQYDSLGQTALGGLLLLSGLLGFILQRSRFCFASAFRELFVTGDGRFARASIIALLVGLIGFATVKASGLRPWATAVNPLGFHTVLGGVIFGLGMVMAGGCASGSIWRAGEGQVQLWVALVGFMLSSAVSPFLLDSIGVEFGPRIFLASVLGWVGAIAASIGVILGWFVIVSWTEVRKSG